MKRLFVMLKKNFWLKASALLFAVILWTFVITQIDPYRNKTITDIPIDFDTSYLERKNLQLRGDPKDVFPDVEVVVSVKLSTYDDPGKNNITITADLSSISTAGEREIELKGESIYGKVVSIKPDRIKVDIDNIKRIPVPVTYEKVGVMPDGLVDGDVRISPKEIIITGPERDLAQADKAVFQIDLSKATEDINSSYLLKILDKEGNEIPASTFVGEIQAVTVQMSVLHKKTVPINYNKSSLIDLDKLPEGYEIKDVKLLPQDTVEIKGSEANLQLIESLDIEGISIEGIDPENPSEIPVKLIIPNGIELVNPVQLRAQVILNKLPEETPASTAISVNAKRLAL